MRSAMNAKASAAVAGSSGSGGCSADPTSPVLEDDRDDEEEDDDDDDDGTGGSGDGLMEQMASFNSAPRVSVTVAARALEVLGEEVSDLQQQQQRTLLAPAARLGAGTAGAAAVLQRTKFSRLVGRACVLVSAAAACCVCLLQVVTATTTCI